MRLGRISLIIFFPLLILSIWGFAMTTTEEKLTVDLSEDSIKTLSNKTIYFGHKSVGKEIINGIQDISTEQKSLGLNIKDSTNSSDFGEFNFLHSWVGSNFNPKSKVDAFAKVMREGLGNKTDIAFFKFCYVDMNEDTNIEELFSYYKKVMSQLEAEFPDTTFVHVTMPLVSEKLPMIRHMKNLVRYVTNGYVTSSRLNVKRTEYNELVRNEYKNGNLFDLAKWESIDLKGNRKIYEKDNKNYYSLYHEYTYDGGHLNENGRRYLAQKLLAYLSNIPTPSNK